jgi:hypothetical protein
MIVRVCRVWPGSKIENRSDIKMINISAPPSFWNDIQLDNFFMKGILILTLI